MRKPGIRPIQTYFKGRLYRSRLEARWAVFLDVLGEPFQYEAEGFELEPVGEAHHESLIASDRPLFYVPDFWLPNVSQWIEIKPVGRPELIELEKLRRLSYWRGEQAYMICGGPEMYRVFPANSIENAVDWCTCRYCRAAGLASDGWSTNLRCCKTNIEKERNEWNDRVTEAIQVASNYRFDWVTNPDHIFLR